MHKYRAGLDYIASIDKGIRFNLSYQHDSAFNSDSALYGGEVQEKNLFDMNIGYQFDNGFRIDISGTNIFDNKYRSCLLYTSPSPRDVEESRMPSSA